MTTTGTVVFLLLLFKADEATSCRSGDCTSVIITGGEYTDNAIEVFLPSCTHLIPPFPSEGRADHSLSVINDTLVACGGLHGWKSCISWKRGQDGWEDFYTLNQGRWNHAAVVVDGEEDIILFGGDSESRGMRTTGEIVKSGKAFSLQNEGAGTCGVSYQGGFVMIGGAYPIHGKVDRYDSKGNYLDSLADLREARMYHACTTFTSSYGATKGEEGLLVVGGYGSNDRLTSTELYFPSWKAWNTGGDLPRAMAGLKAARFSEHVVVTGGEVRTPHDGVQARDEVLQYNRRAGAWPEIGKMKKARKWHAVVAVHDVSLFCYGITDANLNSDNSDNSTTTLTASWFTLAVFFTLFR